jgi:hypothetical protein
VGCHNTRRNTARELTNATLAVIAGDRGRPDDDDLRTAPAQRAFTVRLNDDVPPEGHGSPSGRFRAGRVLRR